MTPSILLIAPVLLLSGFSFVLFSIDILIGDGSVMKARVAFWATLLGLIAAAAFIPCSTINASVILGRGMFVSDGLSGIFSWIAVLSTFFVAILSQNSSIATGKSVAVYYGMLLLSSSGLLMAAMANDFLMIFLAIEMVGVPAFVLTGFYRNSEKSGEAAIKFFLIGAFSSAMLAYGISILYGLVGSTSLTVLSQSSALLQEKAPLAMLAVFFIVVSFGFKIALVPFHMWVPDAFEGAPTPIAAYLSVAPKLVGAALAIRVFNFTLPTAELGALNLLAILAALTMTVANVIGLKQNNVIRLLAYSSIAHMGYVLVGIVAGGADGLASVYMYGWIYLFMNLGTFAVVICLSKAQGSNDLQAYAGLAKRAPALSALLALFIISLAGVPPTAGFVAKFYIFSAAYHTGWFWLLLIAAVNSVIAVGYYFKILHAMYFKEPESTVEISLPLSTRLVLAVTSFVTLFVGLAPQAGFAHIRKYVQQPPVVAQAPQP